MESVHCWNVFIFVMTGICFLVNGGPSELQCLETVHPNITEHLNNTENLNNTNYLNITTGTFTLSKQYNDGSILRYQCPEGYYPYPVKKRKCSRGKWNPAPTRKSAKCKRITCPNPNVLDNGSVNPYQVLYYVNDMINYRCHSDHILRGSPTRVCQLNGKWSGSTAICSIDSHHCPDPGIPPGASRTGHIFDIDDTVSYRCDNKLTLLGSRERVCQDDGTWSGQEPECYADFTYDTPEEVAQAFGISLKAILNRHKQQVQPTKKVKANLNIYIALDASGSIDKTDFEEAKKIVMKLIDKVSYYEVFPNYEILVFATDVARLVSIAEGNGELHETVNNLIAFKYEDRGAKSGTNIAKAFNEILASMSKVKATNKTPFKETHHVIIMFTDGITNMGGDPTHKTNAIKHAVYDGDEANREQYLDLYVFGMGDDVQKEDINEWVTKSPNGKHFFLLQNVEDVKEIFDEMNEINSVGLCGLYKEKKDRVEREGYPWLIKFSVSHELGKVSSCLGSLVTPTFILTAAHCFKFEDVPEKIHFEIPKNLNLAAKNFMLHPKYKPRGKVSEGISEYYEYDVALIELEEPIETDNTIRPICVPCTKETSKALRLYGRGVTCQKHKEELLSKELVNAFFLSAEMESIFLQHNVKIKLGHKRDACIEDAKNALNISHEKARLLITDNFLCTGGEGYNQLDHVSCKGDSGGATFVQQTYQAIQVGVVSWGLKYLCSGGFNWKELETARDFHIDLFNPEIQIFLKKYLSDDQRGHPVHFL
uniref:C3/C5 convertase n=1 Tax=Astyanax mexicanus TaxID=7994 RepID=W5KIJ6_ASTMX